MKISNRPMMLALTAVGISGAALVGLPAPDGGAARPPTSATVDSAGDPAAGEPRASATLHFTDPRGNPRNPTADEARAAAQAFRKDLERLAGSQRGKANVRTLPSGAVAATVATSKVSLLYAVEDEDGTVTIGHSTADGDVPLRPANDLPEE